VYCVCSPFFASPPAVVLVHDTRRRRLWCRAVARPPPPPTTTVSSIPELRPRPRPRPRRRRNLWTRPPLPPPYQSWGEPPLCLYCYCYKYLPTDTLVIFQYVIAIRLIRRRSRSHPTHPVFGYQRVPLAVGCRSQVPPTSMYYFNRGMFSSWLHVFPAPRVSEPRLATTTDGWLAHPTHHRRVDISAVLCRGRRVCRCAISGQSRGSRGSGANFHFPRGASSSLSAQAFLFY